MTTAKAAAARAISARSSAPEIEVRVVSIDDEALAAESSRRSTMRPAGRRRGAPDLDSVPVIAVGKDDLAWFELEAEAHALLAMVDGRTTVEEILASVAVEPEEALEILRGLEAQRVIAIA